MSKDMNYRRMIGSAQWARMALEMKAMAQWKCSECGRVTRRLAVHHIRPVEEARTVSEMHARCFDTANLQVLCYDCHKAKHLRSHTKEKHHETEQKRAERIIDNINHLDITNCI